MNDQNDRDELEAEADIPDWESGRGLNIHERQAYKFGYLAALKAERARGRAAEPQELKDALLEVGRLNLLIKIADELITNENAKKDWQDAKQTRVM